MEQTPCRNAVGRAVRQLRRKRGLTQQMLAARCEVQGCSLSRGTLAKIEAQIRSVADVELHALSSALRVPMQSLFPRDFARWLKNTGWSRE